MRSYSAQRQNRPSKSRQGSCLETKYFASSWWKLWDSESLYPSHLLNRKARIDMKTERMNIQVGLGGPINLEV